MTLTHDVAAFGETMAMFVATECGDLDQVTHFSKRIAGADSNVAIGLSRLGLRVAWLSRVGDDSLGRFILATLAEEGLDCSHVRIDSEHPTGFQLKERRDDGLDPRVEYFRRGSAASHLSLDDFDPELFLGARHLHCTGIPPALGEHVRELSRHAMQMMRAAGRSVSFDTNLRPGLWPDQATMIREVNSLAALAGWVLPGIDEGRLLTGRETPEAIADFYLERGVGEVIVKLGAEGAFYKSATERFHTPCAKVERVVDTVGAGDGFASGFISARLEGLGARDAVTRGTLVGACAIQVAGDMEGLPTRIELDALISTQQ
ncbi:sugar kinase [Phytohalomonas tamaricis]|uniref:sugar kinase n=1 Tax=Phytohalomonas tamaricis TaxID=2081032 RepID=UPI000D0B26D7|nr:sugar kinase [Phytohalomonas tamaricis]